MRLDTGILSELRLAARRLKTDKTRTLTIVMSLAVALGLNSAAFNVAKAIFSDSISPLKQPKQLVSLYSSDPRAPGLLHESYPTIRQLDEESQVFSGVAAFQWNRVNLLGGGRPERVFCQVVSGEYFSVLGVDTILGRTFSEAESSLGGPSVIVLTWQFWDRQFGRDPNVLGRALTINGATATVIGVTPKGFKGTGTFNGPDIFASFSLYPFVGLPVSLDSREARSFEAVARLKDGRTLVEGRAEVETLAARLRQDFPETHANRNTMLLPLSEASVDPQRYSLYRRGGWLLLLVTGLPLLLACVNLASLLFARVAASGAQLGVQLAIGASRWTLLRRFLVESVVLTLLGAIVGLPLAFLAPQLLMQFRPSFVTETALPLGPDATVISFTLGVALAGGLLFGLAPALHATRLNPTTLLKQGLESAPQQLKWGGWRQMLVAFQVAVSVVALFLCALFLESWRAAEAVKLGFNHENVVVLTFDLGGTNANASEGRAFYRDALDKVEAIPGVSTAAFGASRPLNRGAVYRRVIKSGEVAADQAPILRSNSVEADYFSTLEIPLLEGRAFDANDRADSVAVGIVNLAAAKLLWNGESPIGKIVRVNPGDVELQIVGLVANSKQIQIDEEDVPCIYLHIEQIFSPVVTLYARTTTTAERLVEPVRQQIQALNPDLPLSEVRTLGDEVGRRLWAPRLGAAFVSLLAMVALFLGVSGAYGLLSSSLRQREKEMAVRQALGASQGQIFGLVFKKELVVIAVAIGLGLAVSIFSSKALSTLLIWGRESSAGLALQIGLLMSMVAVATCFLAAWRLRGFVISNSLRS